MDNNELERYQQQIIRKKRLELMVKNMLIERDSLAIKIDGFSQYLLEQNEELGKIRDISLAYMYYEMFKEKQEKVDRSIREKYAIAAMYSLTYKELEELNKDIASFKNELSCLNGCKKRYLDIYIKRMNYLKNSGDSKSFELMELDNKIVYLTSQKREMTSAIEAGHILLRSISSVKKGIDSVKSWGNKDSLNGDETLLCKKRQYIDNTQKSLSRMQLALRKFVVELNEVNISLLDQVIIYEFCNFTYNFYEGLFGDESLSKHIKMHRYQLKQIKAEVIDVIAKIKNRCMILEEEIDKLNNKKNMMQESRMVVE